MDWWIFRRPLHAPTEQGRALRLARIEEGRPLRWRCTDCGQKLRKHVYHPGWDNPMNPDIELCRTCIQQYPDRDQFGRWNSFDIVRAF